MRSKLRSRKLWVAVGTIAAIVLVDILGMDLDREALIGMVVAAAAYILGEAWVDARK